MQALSGINNSSLRHFARDLGSEPSEFLNTLLGAVGQAVWVLDKDLQVVWSSEYTEELVGCKGMYTGEGYCRILPNLKTLLGEMRMGGGVSRDTYSLNGKEYEVVCYPVSKEGNIEGYLVTLSNGIRAKISKLAEKQKNREKRLCSLTSRLSLGYA